MPRDAWPTETGNVVTVSRFALSVSRDDSGFNENPNDFVPAPTNAILELVTQCGIVWRTEGAWGPQVRPFIPYRLYLQKNVASPGDLIESGTLAYGDEAKILGTTANGSVMKLGCQVLGAGIDIGTLRIPDYWVTFNSNDVRTTGIATSQTVVMYGDSIAPWPLQTTLDDPSAVQLRMRRAYRTLMRSAESHTNRPTELFFFADACMTVPDGRNRYGVVKLHFLDRTRTHRYPDWEFTASGGRLRDKQIRMLWPIVRVSEDGLLIWNGLEWTTVALTLTKPSQFGDDGQNEPPESIRIYRP